MRKVEKSLNVSLLSDVTEVIDAARAVFLSLIGEISWLFVTETVTKLTKKISRLHENKQ